MSVFYEVNEHLKVEDTRNHPVLLEIAASQLGLLGAGILQDLAGIKRMTLIADGREYRFSGKQMTQEYHELIRALSNAEQVELFASWYYWGWDHVSCDIFAIANFLEEAAEEAPAELEGMFYSLHYGVDSVSGVGTLVAYGEKGGQKYNGAVDFADVSQIPDGIWTTSDTALCYDGEDLQEQKANAIMEVCKKLCQFSEADTLEQDEGSISFFLNNLQIHNERELKEFLRLFVELNELTDGECSLLGELVDCSGPDVKVLHFDVDADGNPILELAQIAG